MAVKSLAYYVAEANIALAHVRSVLPNGPGNASAVQALKSGGMNLVGAAYAKVAGDLSLLLTGTGRHSEAGIAKMAAAAKAFGGGNCQEFAAVAYTFLKHRRVGPIDYMGVYDSEATFFKAKHAFVVLGRDASESPCQTPPEEWPGNVVICDPWADEAYLPADHAVAFTNAATYISKSARYPPGA